MLWEWLFRSNRRSGWLCFKRSPDLNRAGKVQFIYEREKHQTESCMSESLMVLWYVIIYLALLQCRCFQQSRTMGATVLLYAEQVILFYFMKHIHNHLKVYKQKKEAAKLFAARLRLSFVNSIECTEASFVVLHLIDFIYLFIVRILETKEKRSSIV